MKIFCNIAISLFFGTLLVVFAALGIVGGSVVICAASLAGMLLAGG